MSMLFMSEYTMALRIQGLHVLLCIIWNGAGLWQISKGWQSIGPTASWTAIAFMSALFSIMLLTVYRNWRPAYFLASALACFVAVSAIQGGLTKDVSFWPSEFWRYAGIAVNGIGVAGFLLVASIYIRSINADV